MLNVMYMGMVIFTTTNVVVNIGAYASTPVRN